MVLGEQQTGGEGTPLYVSSVYAPAQPYPQQNPSNPAPSAPPLYPEYPPPQSAYPPPASPYPSQGYAPYVVTPPSQPYPSAYQSAPPPPQKEVYIGGYTSDHIVVNFSDTPPSISLPWYTSTQRNVYISKVLAVLFCQLALTTAICYLCVSLQNNGAHLTMPWWALLTLILGTLVLIFAMQAVRKKTPLNYILLFVFTGCISILVALTVAAYTVYSVLNALFVTLIVTLGIIFYVVVTKEDFTFNGLSLAIMALWGIFWWSLFTFILFGLFWTPLSTYGIIFSLFGVLLFTGLLLFDISRIVNRDFDITEDHAVIQGAIALYLDIVNLFLCFLSLFGQRKVQREEKGGNTE